MNKALNSQSCIQDSPFPYIYIFKVSKKAEEALRQTKVDYYLLKENLYQFHRSITSGGQN